MALSLIPPNLQSNKYYAPASAGTVSGTDLTIAATAFVDDTGTAVTAFNTSYANFTLFINGIPQENGSATVTSSDLTIVGGATLNPGDPVILNLVYNF
ncbi:DUF4183 domain-containing protein (plasmid) [Alicyclobacillus fastidiosus]|uniref:DUF4183 domain-containing protein n=1 Tax=Alicyclobacillus fastidiosus TaxID=392011 RepID=A0ABY6ZQZ7_9BACL|nr:DUF4183 domain-containing protein [Alicyclobacillus fastidiosus]WAH45018.1 DUF4183 domain-containing protein [Alicyclobacillus fastidiosus]GMA66202.1 hypothetical protein GCM10025859_66440 [Alicyclobacillus fastidiosus]GMA66237.1 hypothetical protein GCM10025859_66790 [Alicyclobacillus fastidiosus]